MTERVELYESGVEKYSAGTIILGNLSMVLWIGLGTIGCWFFSPIAAWAYLASALIMVLFVLRKFVCTRCYYYNKWCSIGWGKLSALFFKKGDIRDYPPSFGIKLVPVFYGLLTLIPSVLLVISMIQDLTVLKIVILIGLIMVSVYGGAIGRKRTCGKCKMKNICPGSAAS